MPPDRSTPRKAPLAPEAVVDCVASWASRLESALDPRHAAEELLGPLASSVRATRGSVMLLNRETGRLHIVAGLGLPDDCLGQDVPMGPRRISYWVMRERRAVILDGEVRDERFDASAPKDRIASALCVPLPGGERAAGVLNLARTGRETPFTADDLGSVESVTAAIAAILERVRELRSARQLWRHISRRPAPESWPIPRGGEVALTRAEGLAASPAVCEHVLQADGTLVVLLAEPVGEAGPALRVSGWLSGMLQGGAARAATPGAFAAELHQRLSRQHPGEGLRAWLGTFAPNGQVRSCAAGYPTPFFLPAEGEPGPRLTEGGPALGLIDGPIVYEEAALRLLPGDALVVVSDAVLASSSMVGALFGEAGVIECLLEHRRRPLAAMVQEIVSAARSHAGLGATPGEAVAFALRHSRGD